MKNSIFYWSILFYNLIWTFLQHVFTGFVIIHHCPCGFDLVIHTRQPHWLYEKEDDKRKKLVPASVAPFTLCACFSSVTLLSDV